MIADNSIAEQIASLRREIERAEKEPTSVEFVVDAQRVRLAELELVEAELGRRGYRSVREDAAGATWQSVTLDDGCEHLVPAVARNA